MTHGTDATFPHGSDRARDHHSEPRANRLRRVLYLGRTLKARASEAVPQPLEKRMPNFPLGRFRAVLDLRQERWLNPDRAMSDLLGIWWRLANQGLQPGLQLGGRHLIEAVVDLAGIDQPVAFQPANIDAVEFVFLQGETCNRQCLALRAVFFTQSLPRPDV
jgi:hypothetical protein